MRVSQAFTGLLWLCSICSPPLLHSCFAGQVSPAGSWCQPAPHHCPQSPWSCGSCSQLSPMSLAWCVSETPSFHPASHLAALPAPLTSCSWEMQHLLRAGVISEGSLQLLEAPNSPETQQRALLLQAEQGLIARAAAPLQARVPDSQSVRNLMLHVKNTMFTWCSLPRLEG